MIVINVGIAIFFSILGGLFPWFRNKQKNELNSTKQENKTSFYKNIERITASILLIAFSLQVFILPFAGIAHAESGTQISSDEFIQNFDPENTYETHSKTVVPPPNNRMPKDGLGSMSEEELHQYCLESGLAIGVEECGRFTPPEPVFQEDVQAVWYQEPVIPGVVKQVAKKVKGKPAPKTSSKKQLTLKDQLWGFGKGVLDAGKGFAGAVVKAPVQLYQWAKKNPQQAADVLKGLQNPVWGTYQIAKWTWNNRATIANTAVRLKQAGDKYGWTNVAGAVLFSPEAVNAWHNGEYGYALGRGISEFALNIVTFIPPTAAAKIPAIGKKVAAVVERVHTISNVLSGATGVEALAKGASIVVRESAQLLKASTSAEAALGKAVRNEAFVTVVQTVVTDATKAEYIANTASNTAKGNVFKEVITIEDKAAKIAAHDTAIAKTSNQVAEMYKSGKSYSTSMEYVNSGLKTGTMTDKTASTYISTVAKNNGIQTLIADTSRPVVAQTVTELASKGASREVSELNKIGKGIEKKRLTPIAVKTFEDGTSEVLTIDKKGNALVHTMSSDGVLVSKAYKPKNISGEGEFVRAYLGGGEELSGGSKGIKGVEAVSTRATHTTVTVTSGSRRINLQMSYLDVNSPSWTSDQQFMHSLGGEIKNNSLKGVHHVPSNPFITNIAELPGSRNSLGFYKANIEVEINGRKYQKFSTMWPDNWDQNQISDAVGVAFNNKQLDSGNRYYGTTPEGVKILFYEDANGQFNFTPEL
jgi:hypothetical protein